MPLKIVWRHGVAHLHGTVGRQRIRRSAKTRDPELAERIRAETEARLVKAGADYDGGVMVTLMDELCIAVDHANVLA